MSKNIIEVCLLLTSLLLALTAGAADYYVDAENGDDANSGLSPDTPWRTLTHMLGVVRALQDPDPIVHMSSGVYRDGEVFPLEMTHRITINGAGSTNAIIEVPHIHQDPDQALIVRSSSHVVIRDIQIRFKGHDEGDPTPTHPRSIHVESGAHLVLSGCYLEASMHPIDVYGTFVVSACIFSSSRTHRLFHAYEGVILVQDSSIRGYSCMCMGWDWGHYLFDRCTFRDCGEESTCMFSIYDQLLRLRDCQIINWRSTFPFLTGYDRFEYELVNCLFEGCESSFSLFLWFSAGGYDRMDIQHCTLSNNSWNNSFGVFYPGTTPISDSIVWGNDGASAYSGSCQYSCLEPWYRQYSSCLKARAARGTGNIRVNPQLVSGPLGDYYLSHRAAGQDEDSPCVDAGSDSAEALGMDRYTTRTDGVPDTGQVDIGHHYPAFPGAGIELEQDEFTLNDTMYVYGSAWNYALPSEVDVYVGLVRPDGAIWTLGGQGWALGIVPWFTEIEMDTGFIFPLQRLFEFHLPSTAPHIDAPGDYLFAIALPKAGELPAGGDIKLTSFTIVD